MSVSASGASSPEQSRHELFEALGRRDWPATIAACAALREADPHDPDGYVFGVVASREHGELDAAKALGVIGTERFPHHPQMFNETALIFFFTREWADAKTSFADIRARFPDYIEGYTRGSAACRERGENDEALAILEQACDVFAGDLGILRQTADYAETIHEWDRAAALWNRFRTRSPVPEAYDGEVRCLFHAGRVAEVDALKAEAATLASRRAGAGAELTAREIAARFESLGGGSLRDDLWGFGCEFGYYQRTLDLEPLHFLRWASIPPDKLLQGLRDRFDGISDPDQMVFIDNDDPIWNVVHTGYGIRIDHTGLFKKDFAEGPARARLVTHMSYLRDKFLEDLEDGEKIFVYRTFDHVMPAIQVAELASLIKGYGPGQLLYVRLGADDREKFSVERVSDNLLVGHIDFFAPQPEARLVANDEGWGRICKHALELIDP